MSFTMWPSERSGWPSPNHSNFSALPVQWHSQPGFTANVSLTLKSGARPSFSSVHSSLCARNLSPQPRRRRISRTFSVLECKRCAYNSRHLALLQCLRFAYQFDESRTVAICVGAFSFLRPFQHRAQRSTAFVTGIAKNHSKLRHRSSELQIRMRLCEIDPIIISDTALDALYLPVAIWFLKSQFCAEERLRLLPRNELLRDWHKFIQSRDRVTSSDPMVARTFPI